MKKRTLIPLLLTALLFLGGCAAVGPNARYRDGEFQPVKEKTWGMSSQDVLALLPQDEITTVYLPSDSGAGILDTRQFKWRGTDLLLDTGYQFNPQDQLNCVYYRNRNKDMAFDQYKEAVTAVAKRFYHLGAQGCIPEDECMTFLEEMDFEKENLSLFWTGEEETFFLMRYLRLTEEATDLEMYFGLTEELSAMLRFERSVADLSRFSDFLDQIKDAEDDIP